LHLKAQTPIKRTTERIISLKLNFTTFKASVKIGLSCIPMCIFQGLKNKTKRKKNIMGQEPKLTEKI
jgi:hypothetical protein